MLKIEWAGHEWTLRAERAVWWAAKRALLVADAHLGKDAVFRNAGIPVPAATTASDVTRLSALLTQTGARRLIVLGDLLHAEGAAAEATCEAMSTLMSEHRGVERLLVRGNHDRHAGDPPAEWGFCCVDEPVMIDGIALRHHPTKGDAAGLEVAGHVHPAVRISGGAGPSVRARCFVVSERRMVLPAFGGFTGMRGYRAGRGERLLAIGEGEVIELGTAR